MNIYFEFSVTVSGGVGQTSFWTDNVVEPIGRAASLLSANITSVAVQPASGTPTINWTILTSSLFPVTGSGTAVSTPLATTDTSPIFRNSVFKIDSASADGVYTVRVDATAA